MWITPAPLLLPEGVDDGWPRIITPNPQEVESRSVTAAGGVKGHSFATAEEVAGRPAAQEVEDHSVAAAEQAEGRSAEAAGEVEGRSAAREVEGRPAAAAGQIEGRSAAAQGGGPPPW